MEFCRRGQPGRAGSDQRCKQPDEFVHGDGRPELCADLAISNGVCTASGANTTINFQQAPTVSNARGDQSFCGTVVTMSGNNPIAVGTGSWSFAPGGNPDALALTAFSNTAAYNSTFTGTAGQTYILRWTISNGVCASSSDDVQIRLDQNPTTSVASSQTLCGTSANLNGTVPVIGTGAWSFAAGGNPDGLGVISDVNSRTSLFTGTAGQSYVLTWRSATEYAPPVEPIRPSTFSRRPRWRQREETRVF